MSNTFDLFNEFFLKKTLTSEYTFIQYPPGTILWFWYFWFISGATPATTTNLLILGDGEEDGTAQPQTEEGEQQVHVGRLRVHLHRARSPGRELP